MSRRRRLDDLQSRLKTDTTLAAAVAHDTRLSLVLARALVPPERSEHLRGDATLLYASRAGAKDSAIVQVFHKRVWEQAPLSLGVFSRPAPLVLELESNVGDGVSFAELKPGVILGFLQLEVPLCKGD